MTRGNKSWSSGAAYRQGSHRLAGQLEAVLGSGFSDRRLLRAAAATAASWIKSLQVLSLWTLHQCNSRNRQKIEKKGWLVGGGKEVVRWGWQSDLGVRPLVFNALDTAAGEKKERQSGKWGSRGESSFFGPLFTFFFHYKDVNLASMEKTHSATTTLLFILKSKIVNNLLKFTFSTIQNWMHSPATLLGTVFSHLLRQTARQPITRQRFERLQLCASGDADRWTDWEKNAGFEWHRRVWLSVPHRLLCIWQPVDRLVQ